MLGTFINILFQMWTYLFGRPDDEIQRMDDKEHASKGTISVISSDSPRKKSKVRFTTHSALDTSF